MRSASQPPRRCRPRCPRVCAPPPRPCCDPATRTARTHLRGYDEAQLNADLTQPFEAIRPALNQVGAQLTVQAREWYLADVIRIGMADGPLTDGERQAALAIGLDLGMTHAQTIGVIATTEQSAGRG
jgi:hypothetical protein